MSKTTHLHTRVNETLGFHLGYDLKKHAVHKFGHFQALKRLDAYEKYLCQTQSNNVIRNENEKGRTKECLLQRSQWADNRYQQARRIT